MAFAERTLAALLLAASAAPLAVAPCAAQDDAAANAASAAANAAPAGTDAQAVPGDLTAETYGDWTLRCATRENAAPCDIIETMNDRRSGAQVISVSIAYSPSQQIAAVQIIVPLGVRVPEGLTLSVGAVDVSGVRYTRCELQGCFVEARLGDDTLEEMRAADALTLMFAVSPERTARVDVSLDGFADAYDALIAETVARAEPAG